MERESKQNEYLMIGCIDDQGRLDKECKITSLCPTLRAESHGNIPKIIYEIYIREGEYEDAIY